MGIIYYFVYIYSDSTYKFILTNAKRSFAQDLLVI